MSTLRRAVNEWQAADASANRSWSITLTESDRDHLLAAVETTQGREIPDIPPSEATSAALRDVAGAITDQLYGKGGFGFANVEGFPIDGLSREEVIRMYWIFGQLIGQPVSQTPELDFIEHVTNDPTWTKPVENRRFKSTGKLEFHVDPSPAVALLCIQPAKSGGESGIASAARVHNILLDERPDLLAACYEDFYIGRVNEQAAGEEPYYRRPLFSMDQDDQVSTSLPPDRIRQAQGLPGVPALSEEQEAALNAVQEIAQRPEVSFYYPMNRGDMHFGNDYTVLHNRKAFVDHEGPDLWRHLMRLWLQIDEQLTGPRQPAWNDYQYGNMGLTPSAVAAGRAREIPVWA
jgi:hypothetical protein